MTRVLASEKTRKDFLSYLRSLSCVAKLQVEAYEFCITCRLIREICLSHNSFSWLGERKKNHTMKVQQTWRKKAVHCLRYVFLFLVVSTLWSNSTTQGTPWQCVERSPHCFLFLFFSVYSCYPRKIFMLQQLVILFRTPSRNILCACFISLWFFMMRNLTLPVIFCTATSTCLSIIL